MNRRKYFIGISSVLMAVLLTQTAYALPDNINISKNYYDGSMTVSGTAASNEIVSIQIIDKDLELSAVTNADDLITVLKYSSDKEVEADKTFAFTANLTSGAYNIFVSSNLMENPAKLTVDSFYDKEDYEAAVGFINTASNLEEFLQYAGDNMPNLGFDIDLNDNINIDDALKMMYNELSSDKKLKPENYTENIDLYTKCATAVALNEKKSTNISQYIMLVINENENLKELWLAHANSEEREEFFTKKASGKSIEDLEDLEAKVTEALILTAVKYPDGYMSIKSLFTEYKDFLELSKISNDEDVYSGIAGNEYDDIASLKNAYDKLIVSENKATGGGGGNGGGGSKPVSGGKTSMNVGVVLETAVNNDTNPLKLKFEDLGSVQWAYSSISILYEAGIISGVNEYEFRPEATVKREEFTKMLVGAMGIYTDSTDINFSDCISDAWYAKYVNAAYNSGIVNGISGTEFGISLNITRQDMAVMVYRALCKKGYENKNSELTFYDADQISDYAKVAIAELADIGVINGVGDNTFAPLKTATRAEAAVIIQRVFSSLKQN